MYEQESMKMNALSYMIKYFPCVLVNFRAAITIWKNILLTKCTLEMICPGVIWRNRSNVQSLILKYTFETQDYETLKFIFGKYRAALAHIKNNLICF